MMVAVAGVLSMVSVPLMPGVLVVTLVVGVTLVLRVVVVDVDGVGRVLVVLSHVSHNAIPPWGIPIERHNPSGTPWHPTLLSPT